MLAHGPADPESISRQHQTAQVMPPQLKIGKDERGTFRTAPRKEYREGHFRCLVALRDSRARPLSELSLPVGD